MLRSMYKVSGIGRPMYSLELCLYVTLRKLSNQDCFREISDKFGIGRGTVYKLFKKTLMFILKLKKRFIKCPESQEFQKKIVEKFEKKRANPFPFVLGCLDGTHFEIPAPKEDSRGYYSRHKCYSIVMQMFSLAIQVLVMTPLSGVIAHRKKVLQVTKSKFQ